VTDCEERWSYLWAGLGWAGSDTWHKEQGGAVRGSPAQRQGGSCLYECLSLSCHRPPPEHESSSPTAHAEQQVHRLDLTLHHPHLQALPKSLAKEPWQGIPVPV
jgi:hypothetical protein